jgi:hypothetical protein
MIKPPYKNVFNLWERINIVEIYKLATSIDLIILASYQVNILLVDTMIAEVCFSL